MRTSYICPDKSRLKNIPNRIPLAIDIATLMKISKDIISLRSNTEIPIDLSILNTSDSYLHFPYVYTNKNKILKEAKMIVTRTINALM